jgi:hypothetical protein
MNSEIICQNCTRPAVVIHQSNYVCAACYLADHFGDAVMSAVLPSNPKLTEPAKSGPKVEVIRRRLYE